MVMARIYRRGDVWYVDYANMDGQRVRRAVGRNKRLAEEVLRKIEGDIARQRLGLPIEVSSGEEKKHKTTGVATLLERYMDVKGTWWRSRTQRRYRCVADHFLRFLSEKHLHHIPADAVTGALVEEFMGWRLKQGRKKRTVNFECEFLRSVWKWGQREGYVERNPFCEVSALREDDSRKPRVLSPDEVRRLIEAADPWFHDALAIFLYTGMRKGEVLNLTCGDVDLAAGVIHIRAKDDWRPKTGERTLPLHPVLYRVVRRLCKGRSATAYLLGESDGEKCRKKLRRMLIRTAAAAGVPNLTRLHDLRHTFATRLLEVGVDPFSVAVLLGHSLNSKRFGVTSLYLHPSLSHLTRVLRRLSYGVSVLEPASLCATTAPTPSSQIGVSAPSEDVESPHD